MNQNKLTFLIKNKTVTKAIGLVAFSWSLRFGAINSNDPFVDSSGLLPNNQRLGAQDSFQKTDGEQSIKIKTGSGTILIARKKQKPTSEASKSALQVRSGDLGKSGPGARAKADARNASINGGKGTKSKPGGSGFAKAWSQNSSNQSRPGKGGRVNGLFGRFSAQPSPDPYNPGNAGGPRSITVRSTQDNPSSSAEQNFTTIETHDGFKAQLTDKSENHLTSKHGHTFGVDDPLPVNPNQNPTKYKQTRTRLNAKNKAKVRRGIKSILSNKKTDVYIDVSIRGVKGRVYHCKETNVIVGIHTEGQFEGLIIKAQPISDKQLQKLQDLNKID